MPHHQQYGCLPDMKRTVEVSGSSRRELASRRGWPAAVCQKPCRPRCAAPAPPPSLHPLPSPWPQQQAAPRPPHAPARPGCPAGRAGCPPCPGRRAPPRGHRSSGPASGRAPGPPASRQETRPASLVFGGHSGGRLPRLWRSQCRRVGQGMSSSVLHPQSPSPPP